MRFIFSNSLLKVKTVSMHEQESNKIQEPTVGSSYPDFGSYKYFLSVTKILEEDTTGHLSLILNPQRTLFDWTKNLTLRSGSKSGEEEFWSFPETTAWTRRIDLGQLWLHQLLRRLRKEGERKVADRVEYLTSEDNVEDGGDIPVTSTVASFVKFYFDNPDLGQPLLGVTPTAELQAVWKLSGRRRLVVEFQDKDIVRYVYRRSGNMSSAKFFIMGRQPRHKIRGILENAAI